MNVNCFCPCLLIGIKRNAFTKSIATCHVHKALQIYSSNDTTLSTAAVIRATWLLVAVCSHSFGLIQFLQGPDWWIKWGDGEEHCPCIFQLINGGIKLHHSPGLQYCFDLPCWQRIGTRENGPILILLLYSVIGSEQTKRRQPEP